MDESKLAWEIAMTVIQWIGAIIAALAALLAWGYATIVARFKDAQERYEKAEARFDQAEQLFREGQQRIEQAFERETQALERDRDFYKDLASESPIDVLRKSNEVLKQHIEEIEIEREQINEELESKSAGLEDRLIEKESALSRVQEERSEQANEIVCKQREVEELRNALQQTEDQLKATQTAKADVQDAQAALIDEATEEALRFLRQMRETVNSKEFGPQWSFSASDVVGSLLGWLESGSDDDYWLLATAIGKPMEKRHEILGLQVITLLPARLIREVRKSYVEGRRTPKAGLREEAIESIASSMAVGSLGDVLTANEAALNVLVERIRDTELTIKDQNGFKDAIVSWLQNGRSRARVEDGIVRFSDSDVLALSSATGIPRDVLDGIRQKKSPLCSGLRSDVLRKAGVPGLPGRKFYSASRTLDLRNLFTLASSDACVLNLLRSLGGLSQLPLTIKERSQG